MPLYKWSRFFLADGSTNGSTRGPKDLKRQTQTQTLDSSPQPPIIAVFLYFCHTWDTSHAFAVFVFILEVGKPQSLFNKKSHSSFSPLNSTIHGVLFSAFYENSLPNNNKEYRHSICVPTYYHISLVIYWETQADGRCYFLADSFLYFLLLPFYACIESLLHTLSWVVCWRHSLL